MTVCYVGAFRTPYADPLSSWLLESLVRRSPVAAEGIVLCPRSILQMRVSKLPTFLVSANKRPSRLATCVGLSPCSSSLTNLCRLVRFDVFGNGAFLTMHLYLIEQDNYHERSLDGFRSRLTRLGCRSVSSLSIKFDLPSSRTMFSIPTSV